MLWRLVPTDIFICCGDYRGTMYLRPATRKGNTYWSIVEGRRSGDRVRQSQVLYLGRLDDLSPQKRGELEHQVLALRDDGLLHTFYARLAEHGHPVPRVVTSELVEDGPFSLPPVDFATLTDALRQDDLTSRDLAALVSRIGLPLRPEELLAVGVRVETGKKTTRSIFLFYRATSPPLPPVARPATGSSRSRKRSDGRSKPSATP